MATDKDLQRTRDDVAFEKDALKFCQKIYSEANERNEQLHDINVENQLFYEGYDQRLEERRNDRSVVRSALFVNELAPAVDARIGDLISAIDEDEYPIKARSTVGGLDDATRDNIEFCERTINEQLRACKYLSDVANEQCLAAELHRSPSVVKVYMRRVERDVAELRDPELGMMDRGLVMMGLKKMPEKKVVYKKVVTQEPYVEWLPPDEVLIEPGKSVYPDDFTYMGHRIKVDRESLYAMADEFGWDDKEIDQFFSQREEGGESNRHDDMTVAQEVQAAKDTPLPEDMDLDKYEVVEWYISVYDNQGKEDTWQCVVLENSHVLTNKKWKVRELKFPFVMLVAHRQLGSSENLSTIDKCKDLQRLHSESYNSLIDGLTYRIFPPFKNKINNTFDGTPVYGPGRVWNIQEPEFFSPVIENPGQMPDLVGLIDNTSAKIRDQANAPDTSEGISAAQYEKATKTNLRVAGAIKRSSPMRRRFGMAIIQVADTIMALNRQYHEEAWRFVVPVRLDVPSLTSVSDPQQEKQDMLLLYSTMSADPLFQSPLGQRKKRAAWEDLVRLIRKTGWERYTITEKELELQIADMAQMQALQMQKMALAEDAASSQQQQQLEQPPQESSNVPVQ